MEKETISTAGAPAAIGPYSQAVRTGLVVFLSGQIGIDPATQAMVEGGFEAQARQALRNLEVVAKASGGSLRDAVKFTLYLTDLSNFAIANRVMEEMLAAPFPARATVGVASLPRGALFEADAILVL
jgi:2-iminobutanoate/2-iminopropanoate deaminase